MATMDEISSLLEAFNKVVEAGKQATLSVTSRGSKIKAKLVVKLTQTATPPFPPPNPLPTASGQPDTRRRRKRGPAARAKARARAIAHQAAKAEAAASTASGAAPPPSGPLGRASPQSSSLQSDVATNKIFSCENCEKTFGSEKTLKVHMDAATVFCHTCDKCMNDDFNPAHLMDCIEKQHQLEGLQWWYETAEEPDWWMLFTADPDGDPDHHFDYLITRPSFTIKAEVH